ncbi:Putative Immunoglobulin-like domain-containing protein [Colletotrichum destructivum]|uniref:Immunoglobulin-like domain-containing protein n=1 Tax=Colletotrichum destructivum TaxID=34406 RepID=A0AAX4I153_9PEZI|nr:Putative Immunoglobulin-like domain-containing protein [Colletotrichum destructivum]
MGASLPSGCRPIKMWCQCSISSDVISDWVSSMSPHTESPRCSAVPSEGAHAIRDWRHETALSMPGLARTPCPATTPRLALSSEGHANRIRPHITISDQHLQPSAGAHQTAHVVFYDEKRQPGRQARTARAEIRCSASGYNLNGCAMSAVDDATEWEDSTEASETFVERLRFVRRVDLGGTAAGRSLIRIMLEQSRVGIRDKGADACAA